MHNLTQYFTQFGSPAGAQARAFGYIGHIIADQAALMGYIDIFYSWSIFAAVLVPVVLLLIRRDRAVCGGGGQANGSATEACAQKRHALMNICRPDENFVCRRGNEWA